MNRAEDRIADDGFALLAVIWMLALIALIGATTLTIARQDVRARGQWIHKAQLQITVDGTTQRLVYAAIGPGQSTVPIVGDWQFCKQSGVTFGYRLSDAAGLVDINAASIETLKVILIHAGLPQAGADQLASAIVDFRDSDNLAGVGGSEADRYTQIKNLPPPKNAPFATVEELDQVVGMSSDLLRKLAPLVTIYGRKPQIDLSVAPREIVEAFSAEPPSPKTVFHARAIHIAAVAWDRADAIASRYAVLEANPHDARGATFREWSLSPRLTNAPARPSESRACAMGLMP